MSLGRIAVADGLFGERKIPPGQRWIYPFVSVRTGEAAQRVIELEAALRALELDVHRKMLSSGPLIELEDARGQPITFLSMACTIAGLSGQNSIGVIFDEEAKMRDEITNASPAREVLASIIQTFRSRPGIRGVRCSSPWSTTGSHAESIAEGPTATNYIGRIGERFLPAAIEGLHEVAQWEEQQGDAAAAWMIRQYAATVTADSPNVPTWIGNPTISAIASREGVNALARSAREGTPRVVVWLRENASVPMPAATTAHVGDFSGLAAENRRMVSGSGSGLKTFNGLPSWDPRSMDHGDDDDRTL
jgi:hypothetical protein